MSIDTNIHSDPDPALLLRERGLRRGLPFGLLSVEKRRNVRPLNKLNNFSGDLLNSLRASLGSQS